MKYSLGISLLVLPFLFSALSVHAATPSIQVSEVSYAAIEKSGKAPTCKTYFTYKKPRVGETTTLLWRSRGADYMTGLYTKDRREVRGSQNIRFGHPGEQNFALTFTGPGGSTMCTVRIMVREKLEESV